MPFLTEEKKNFCANVCPNLVVLEGSPIEACFKTCEKFLAEICAWFCEQRCSERFEILSAACALQKECADFPFFCFDGLCKNRKNFCMKFVYLFFLRFLFLLFRVYYSEGEGSAGGS